MPNPLVDLVTAEEAEAHMAAGGMDCPDDETLDWLVTAASSAVSSYLNRELVSQPWTHVCDGKGGSRIFLPNTPVTAVTSLKIDDIAIPAAANARAAGYIVTENGIALRGHIFHRGVMNVEIAYTGGYATIPPIIKAACLETLRAMRQTIERETGVTSMSAGGHSLSFASPESVIAGCFTPHVTAMLRGFERVIPAA